MNCPRGLFTGSSVLLQANKDPAAPEIRFAPLAHNFSWRLRSHPYLPGGHPWESERCNRPATSSGATASFRKAAVQFQKSYPDLSAATGLGFLSVAISFREQFNLTAKSDYR